MKTSSFAITQFHRLVWACMFAAMVTFLNGFLGNILAGNLLGAEALSGVSLAGPLVFTLHFLSILLGDGMSILYCRRLGALDRTGAERVFVQGIWSIFIVGGIAALVMGLGREAFLSLMKPAADVAAHARDYWTWLVPSAVLLPASTMLLGCCYADGDVVLSSISFVVQLVVNLVLSWWMLSHGFGTASCSIGVAAGALVACGVLSLHFLRGNNTFTFRWCWSLRDIFRILFAALGDASGVISEALVIFVLGWIVIARYGTDALLGVAIFSLLLGIEALVNGFTAAMQPLVAVYYGERNVRSVGLLMRYVTAVIAILGLLITLAALFWPQLVLMVLGLNGHANQSQLEFIVRIVALGTVPNFILNLFNNYFQYIGHELFAIGGSLFCSLMMPIVSVVVFSFCLDSSWFWVWWPTAQLTGVGLFLFWCGIWARRHGCEGPLMLDRRRLSNLSVIDLQLDENVIEAASVRVGMELARAGAGTAAEMRAQLMTEEVLMAVRERNAGRKVSAEVTLDLNDGVMLTLRDDGEIFDITDSDAKISSVRSFLVACMMERQRDKANVLTTGFNRNVFKFKGEDR